MNKLLHAILLLLTIILYQAVALSTTPGQSASVPSTTSQSYPSSPNTGLLGFVLSYQPNPYILSR